MTGPRRSGEKGLAGCLAAAGMVLVFMLFNVALAILVIRLFPGVLP